MAGPLDLTNVFIEDTYPRLIQTDGVYLYDGTGSLFNIISSSYASNGGVTQLLAGSNIILSPSNGKGQVTITSTGGGGGVGNTSTGSYGSFYDTGSYLAASATTIYSMSLSTTDISNGVYVSGSDRTKVYFMNSGVYNFQFSAQFSNTDNAGTDVTIWVRKNDIGSVNDIPDSAGVVTVPPTKAGQNGQIIAGWNYYVTAAAGDYIQLLWTVDVANKVTLETIPAGVSPVHPRVPSLIVTTNRIDQFLSNTGSFSGSFTGHLIGTADVANSVTTLNQDLIVSEGYKIYISSPAEPSAGISSYSDPISQLTSVGQYSGDTIKGTAGDSLNPGQLIYLNTDGLWYLADATPDATNGSKSAINLLGILVGNTPASTNDDIVVLLQGNVCAEQVTVGTGNGRPLWVSVDAGSIQNTAPSSTNNVVRQVGHVLDTNIIRFSPDNYFSIVP